MFCPKCGKKIPPSSKHCPHCGKTLIRFNFIKQLTDWLTLIKNKPSILKVIKLIPLLAIGILIVCTIFFGLPKLKKTIKYRKVEKEQAKIASEYPILKGIELRFLGEAEQKAKDWSKKAFVCYFSTSLDYLKDDAPYTELSFCSPEKKESLFNYRWHNPKSIDSQEEENKFNYQKPIEPFPPLVGAEETLALTIEKFNKTKPENFEVDGASPHLKGGDDFWTLHLKIVDTSSPTNEKIEKDCSVYFDRQIYCEAVSSPSSTGNQDYPSLLANVELSGFGEAKQKALAWDNQAQLCQFMASLYPLSSSPLTEYNFSSGNKEEIFQVRQASVKSRPEAKTQIIKYIQKPAILEFPPPLSASEASNLALTDWEAKKAEDEKMESFYLILQNDFTRWTVGVRTINEQKQKQEIVYYVNFDKTLQLKP